MLTEGRKSWKLILEDLIEDLMLAATLTKYLIKLMANSCGSFKLRTLSNVLGGV